MCFSPISNSNTGIQHIYGTYFNEFGYSFFLKKKLAKHCQLNLVK